MEEFKQFVAIAMGFGVGVWFWTVLFWAFIRRGR